MERWYRSRETQEILDELYSAREGGDTDNELLFLGDLLRSAAAAGITGNE